MSDLVGLIVGCAAMTILICASAWYAEFRQKEPFIAWVYGPPALIWATLIAGYGTWCVVS